MIPALGHAWGATSYVWTEENDSLTATRICQHDESHLETETVVVTGLITKAPTCEMKGETTYTSIDFNNPAFTAQMKTVEDVEALGHDWREPTYEWNADNSSVTASRICNRDTTHTEVETASTVFTLIKAPTENEMGESNISVTFENEVFEAQEKSIADIPALKDLSIVRIPGTIKSIGEEAFMGIANEAVLIPDGCISIGNRAFANCPNLIYVRLPGSVTEIAHDAFAGSRKVRIDRDVE